MPIRTLRLWHVGVCLALLAGTGCEVENVAWLPDSSGFVYTRNGSQLIHYDLKTRTRRVVVKDTKTRTPWPAVSPDGKRVAVARSVSTFGKPDTLQVIVYSLSGKEQQRSATFHGGRGKARVNDGLNSTYLGWSPDGDKLLVYVWGEHGCWMAIYDRKTDRLKTLDDLSTPFPLMWSDSPICPDGKGFLIACDDVPSFRNEKKICLVDWEGKQYDIAFTPAELTNAVIDPFRWRWDGISAVGVEGRMVVRIDTAKRTGSVETGRRVGQDSEPKGLHQQYELGNNLTLRSVKFFGPGDGPVQIGSGRYRVELFDRRQKKVRVLFPMMEENCNIFLSPDRKLFAVRSGRVEDHPHIAVVKDDGEILCVVKGDKD
jgi:hypothetical protein